MNFTNWTDARAVGLLNESDTKLVQNGTLA